MSSFRPNMNNFTAGELSPKMLGRTDLQQYFNGCKTLKNFHIMPTGALEKRAGSKFVANMGVYNGRLAPFSYQNGMTCVVCAYTYPGTYGYIFRSSSLSGSPDVYNEITTLPHPYDTNEKISYLKKGAKVGENVYWPATIYPYRILALSAYQTPYIFYVNPNQAGMRQWDTADTYDIDEYVEHSGHIYKSLQTANTGNTPSIGGTAYWDDLGGDPLDPTEAGEVDPFGISGTAFGAGNWGQAHAVIEHESRMILAGFHYNPSDGRVAPIIVGSRIQSPLEWLSTNDTDDSEPFSFILYGIDDYVKWIEGKDYLFMGTVTGIYRVSVQGITPTNIQIDKISSRGAGDVSCLAGDTILFTGTDNKRIFGIQYNDSSSEYLFNEVSVGYNHFFTDEIVRLEYQNAPEPIVWAVLADGNLIGIQYDRINGINGAWLFETNGDVQDVCYVNGTLSMIVLRGLNYIIEKIEYYNYFNPSDVPQNKKRYLDSAVSEDDPADLSAISGLDHLEGMEVYCLVNGMELGPYTVSGGEIDISDDWEGETVTHIITGLRYEAVLETMPFEVQNGSGLYTPKRVTEVDLLVQDSGEAIQVGPSEDNTSIVPIRTDQDDMDAPVDLYSGFLHHTISTKWKTAATLVVKSEKAVPLNITAILPLVEVKE